jgi:hypothetical protein
MRFSRLGRQVNRTAVIGGVLLCALVGMSAVAATAANADPFTWLGPTSLQSTGGSHALPTVSCPTAGQCTTVDSRGEQITYNPGNAAIASRSAVDAIGAVSSVSCPSTSQCTAVDNGGNEITFNPVTGVVNAAGRTSLDPSHHLTAVSCASGTRCTTVDNAGNEITFDPSSGSAIGSAGNVDSPHALNAVSCLPGGTGTQQCTTVDTAGHEVTFTVASDGTPAVSSSSPIDGSAALTGASCPSTSQCAAVDGQGNEITFTPATGTIVGAATQIESGIALNAVSCSSATQCVAVDTQGNEVSFTPGASPAPSVHSVDGTVFLAAVSCPANAGTCSALDNQGREIGFTPSGTVSARASIVPPALSGVSCPTRTQCTAIASGTGETTFDPTSGTVNGAGVKAIDSSGNPLTSVACVSASQCVAVDNGGNEVTFDPTTGNVIANGFISVDTNALRSVSCILVAGSGNAPPTPQCTTVDTAGNEVTFNPSTSTINNAGLNRVDLSGGALESVSCPSSTACTGVDSNGDEVTFSPVTGQNLLTQQFVTLDSGHILTSVWCPSTSQCTAVDDGGGVITPFDPTTVSSTPVRQQVEVASTGLNAVVCPSSGQCTAVDGLGQEATFSPTSTSLSSGLLTQLSGANALDAVSCNSTSICVTVDAEGNDFAGIEAPVDTGLPTISGTAQEGVQLSETNGTWTNFPTGYVYQWEDCTSSGSLAGCAPVAAGGTGPTYTPTLSDIGQFLRVQETASNQGGAGQAVLSLATARVTPSPAINGAPPTLTSAAPPYQEGQMLTEHHGTWNESSSAPLTYSYQWQRCNAAGATNTCGNITGATSSTYSPVAADVGGTLRVLETADNGGTPVPAGTPSAVTPVLSPAPATNTVPPSITGARDQEGQMLTEQHGSWSQDTSSPLTYTYQWQDCTSAGDPASCSNIPAASSPTYTPTSSDVGQYIRVRETADNGGTPVPPSASSAATAVVVPLAPSIISPPTISGAIEQGMPLTEQHGVWSGGVDSPTGYGYQWEDCTASGAGCVRIDGATSATYTPAASDVGHAIVVLETASNAGGSSDPAGSAPTAPTAPAPAPPIQAVSRSAKPVRTMAATVRGQLQTQGLAVSWQFVYGITARYTAGTPIQSISAGGGATVPVSWVVDNLKPDTTYHYRLVETVAAAPYSPAATAYGEDLTFKTSSLGKITLGRTRLSVSPAGVVAVPLFCQSALACVDRFSITTRAEVGRASARHLGTVLCNTDLTRVPARSRRSVTVALTKECLALLQTAAHRQLAATFTTRPRSGQLGAIEKITLIAAPSKHVTHRARSGSAKGRPARSHRSWKLVF